MTSTTLADAHERHWLAFEAVRVTARNGIVCDEVCDRSQKITALYKSIMETGTITQKEMRMVVAMTERVSAGLFFYASLFAAGTSWRM